MALAENMEVDVTHRLTAVFTIIRHDSESLFQSEFQSNLLNSAENGSQHRAVGRTWLDKTLDMLSRYRENMNRCLRIEVAKHDDIGILVNDVGRNLALRNPAENTSIHSQGPILLHPKLPVNQNKNICLRTVIFSGRSHRFIAVPWKFCAAGRGDRPGHACLIGAG